MKNRKSDFEQTMRLNYRRLINILDQKTGREKRILRKYAQALERAIRNANDKRGK